MSSFFDKIRSGAGKAAFEADKLRRTNAIQSEIRELRDEARQALNRVGDVAYELYRDGKIHQAVLVQACQQVQAVQEQIGVRERHLESIRQEEYEEETPTAQYGRTCPRGHGPIPPDNYFCQECGARAVEVAAPTDPTSRLCAECGQPLGPQARFCANCGTPAPEAEAEPTPTFCQECGTKLLANVVFCGECGTPVASRQEKISSETEVPPEPEAPTSLEVEREWEYEQEKPPPIEVVNPPEEPTENDVDLPSLDSSALESGDLDESAAPTAEETVFETSGAAHGETSLPDDTDGVQQEGETVEDEGDSCPVCETPRLADALFCAECGYRFDGEGAGGEVQTEVEMCPACDTLLFPDALFCAECGHSLSVATD